MKFSKCSTILKQSKAFTLIETLVAVMIFAGALMTLTATWSSSKYALTKSKTMENIAGLLRSKVSEYEVKYRSKKFNEIKEEESGTFEGYENLRWVVKIEEFAMPDMRNMLPQDEGQDGMLLTVLNKMTEIFEKNIKEMKVSVYWKVDEKELEYSVTTLLVDYSQPIDLMGGL